MTTSDYINELENRGLFDDLKMVGIKDLELKIGKIDKENQAILITTNQAISLWIEYWFDEFNDLNWDYNQYIFCLDNVDDLIKGIVQQQYYDEIDALVYEAVGE